MPDELKEVYHVCYSENSLEFPNATKVRKFWNNEHKVIEGIDFVTGISERFGLPAIRETLYVLKNTFWKPGIELING